ALEKLFGKQGACMGCWCMYWQLPRKQWNAARGAVVKRSFRQGVNESPPGVLALIEDDAVAWLQIAPRADAPQWNGARRVSAPLKEADAEDPRVWTTTCFYVKSSARGQGISEALLKAGIAFAKKNGARAIEACPIDGDASADADYVGHTPH